MPNRDSFWHQASRLQKWKVVAACVVVGLLPIPMWIERSQDTQDRKDRNPVTVTVASVVEQGNDDLVSAYRGDDLISFQYPGRVSVGDRVEVYFSHSQWKAVEQAPLWVPIAASALCWIAVGIVVIFYPRMSRRRGWR